MIGYFVFRLFKRNTIGFLNCGYGMQRGETQSLNRANMISNLNKVDLGQAATAEWGRASFVYILTQHLIVIFLNENRGSYSWRCVCKRTYLFPGINKGINKPVMYILRPFSLMSTLYRRISTVWFTKLKHQYWASKSPSSSPPPPPSPPLPPLPNFPTWILIKDS